MVCVADQPSQAESNTMARNNPVSNNTVLSRVLARNVAPLMIREVCNAFMLCRRGRNEFEIELFQRCIVAEAFHHNVNRIMIDKLPLIQNAN